MSERCLVVADLHAGSTVAPWPEGILLPDGGRYQPATWQRYLNDCWADLVEAARRLRPQVIVVNGDVVQGTKTNKDGQLVTYSVACQAQAARALLEPLADCCERLYVVRGTEWHEGACSQHVEQLAASLGAEANHAGQHAWPDLYLELGGRVIHFAHHIGVSGVPAYEATVPLRDAITLVTELWRTWGRLGPRVELMVRSHRHRYVHVDAPGQVQAVVTPGWQLKAAFGYRVAPVTWCHIGWILIESEADGLRVSKRIYDGPPPVVQRLEVAHASDTCASIFAG